MADLDALLARWRDRAGADRLRPGDALRRRAERYRFADDAAYFAFLIERANREGSEQADAGPPGTAP